ncbi:MAG: glutamate--tRNA ligase [Planctomycetota bacterium]
MSDVRVRIAPSPTGPPHVGTAYIGLFDYAFAHHTGGTFVLRIEDTDRKRSSKESEDAIVRALRWIGLEHDEGPDVGGPYGPYRQSQRSEIYQEHARKLVEEGHAYYCFCTPERLARMRKDQQKRKQPPMYDGTCRDLPPDEVERRLDAGEPAVVRLKVPRDGETAYVDLVRKKGEPVVFQNRHIDDQVLLKSDGFPTYHLANVVDDHLMRITHVIRAEEWVNSTPKHILLYQAFGWDPPAYAHMPLLRNPDKSKISKRKNHTSLDWYRQQGFLPEAMLNFLALMGFSSEEGDEVFDLETMVREFSWDRVKTSQPVFDVDKLEWLNGVYIRNLPVDELIDRLRPFGQDGRLGHDDKTRKMVEIIQERLKTLAEFDRWTWFFFTDDLDYDLDTLVPRKTTPAETETILRAAIDAYQDADDWTTGPLEQVGRDLCEQLDFKVRQVFMILRVAVTGSTQSPPLFESMDILGKPRSLKRLRDALDRVVEPAGSEKADRAPN